MRALIDFRSDSVIGTCETKVFVIEYRMPENTYAELEN